MWSGLGRGLALRLWIRSSIRRLTVRVRPDSSLSSGGGVLAIVGV